MAPVLQCPDCGERHPLAKVPTQGAFPCQGCGRVLKVPEAVGQRAAAQTAAARPVPVASAVASPTGPVTPVDPAATRVATGAAMASATPPPVDEQALGALAPKGRRPVARLGTVPWWMRLLLWIVAVPLGFLIVFMMARALGLFTTNQLSDLFLANDTARFWPVARLLPFVALMTALLVTGGVYGLARLRGRKGGGRSPSTELNASASRTRRR